MTRFRSATAAVAMTLALAIAACGDSSSGPSVGPPSALTRTLGDNQTGPAGEALQTPLTVRVADSQGSALSGISVSFAVEAGGGSVSAAQVTTSAEGTAQTTWTLGQQAGAEQRVSATILRGDGTAVRTTFNATAAAGAPALLAKIAGDNQRGGTGAALNDSLVVRVTDRFGNGVPWISVTWASLANGRASPAAVSTDEAGFARTAWLLGDNMGAARLEATAGALAAAAFTAEAVMSITSIEPAIIGNGSTVSINGIGFSPAVAANTVTIAGIAMTVTEASDTRIRATLPARAPCIPSGTAAIAVRSADLRTSRTHPVELAPLRPFAVGQALTGTPDDVLSCVALPSDGSRYLIAVTNTTPTVSNAANQGFRLRATGFGPSADVPAAAQADAYRIENPLPRLSSQQTAKLSRFAERRGRHVHEHGGVLRTNLRLLENDGAAFRQRAAERLRAQSLSPASLVALPAVGDTLSMRVPRLGTGAVFCSQVPYDAVRARVAYVGTRSIVLEDVSNPVTNVLDALYRQMGEEFDTQQYDIVKENFGDPLLLDVDGNQRLFMLFTRRVDSDLAAGFVHSCDFGTTGNNAEVFYGYVPTSPSMNYEDDGSAAEWFWAIRATVIHEVKHIASFAARLSKAQFSGYEEEWLEEASAMAAEEIWARRVFGYTAGGNTGYSASLGCEIRGAFNIAPCQGKPAVMFLHFMQLARWLRTPDARSPLGSTTETDASFYGSGWLFLRWLAENSGKPESQFLRELTESTTSGGANVQQRMGRPFADLLAEWALAVALDDRQGVAPANSRLRIASWNLRDVYAGLNFEQPPVMPDAWPFSSASLAFGSSMTAVPSVRGGGTKFFELSGAAQSQALEFLGSTTDELPNSMRVTIFRIQ